MSFSEKIAAFDLDGTLTESKQPLTSEMANLLSRLTTKTIVVVISGASFGQFERQFLTYWPENGSIKENLILLPTSGSQCYEYCDKTNQWELVDEVPFPPELKSTVLKVLAEIIASNQFDIPKNKEGEYVEDRSTQITFSAIGQKARAEQKQAWDPDEKKRQKIKNELERQIQGIDISFGGMTSIDILPQGFNKANGLRRLLKRKNLLLSDVIFIGDSEFPSGNDYPVLEMGTESKNVIGPKETKKIIEGWLA
jgi:phosphomannomutase